MRIRWTGSRLVRRVVGPYEWSKATGYVQDVAEPVLAAALLTEPQSQFTAEKLGEQDAQALGDALGVEPEDVLEAWSAPVVQTEREVAG